MARNETTPAQVIYSAAGLPAMIGSSAGICRLCGCDGIGQKFNLWVKDTFTDHDKLFPGDIICHACQFCTIEASEQLATMMGKDKPQRMRNYSHFVHNGEWIPLSKGDKGRMIDLLKKFPPVAVIAISGQKHIIFRARLGWWQIEEQSTTPLANLWKILEVVTTMYNGGFSKDEITTGRYIQRRIGEYGVTKFIQHEDIVKRARGSNALELAIFLAQKDNEDGRIPIGINDLTKTNHI